MRICSTLSFRWRTSLSCPTSSRCHWSATSTQRFEDFYLLQHPPASEYSDNPSQSSQTLKCPDSAGVLRVKLIRLKLTFQQKKQTKFCKSSEPKTWQTRTGWALASATPTRSSRWEPPPLRGPRPSETMSTLSGICTSTFPLRWSAFLMEVKYSCICPLGCWRPGIVHWVLWRRQQGRWVPWTSEDSD